MNIILKPVSHMNSRLKVIASFFLRPRSVFDLTVLYEDMVDRPEETIKRRALNLFSSPR